MAGNAKVVLTDYVWESLDVEKKILGGLAEIVPMQTKKPEEFLAEANVAILATVDRKGRPHAAPIWYLYEDGALVMSTGHRLAEKPEPRAGRKAKA